MNDPMEGVHRLSTVFSKQAGASNESQLIENARVKLGIASFSEVLYHEPMWAHYTDKFEGICIAYNFSRLLSELDDNVRFVRMNYNDNAPILRWKKGTVDENARLTISTKTSRWSYEREWRLISPSIGAADYENNCVVRVYLGSKIDGKEKKLLIRHLEDLNIPVSQMTLDKYSMRFEPIPASSNPAKKPSKVLSKAGAMKKAKPVYKVKRAVKRRA